MFYASNICINNGFGFGGFGYMPFYNTYNPFCAISTPYFYSRPLFCSNYYYPMYGGSSFAGAYAGAALGSMLGSLFSHRA